MNQELVVASELSVVVVAMERSNGGRKNSSEEKICLGCDYGGNSQIAGSIRL